jgi:hypothetical protein
MNVTKRMLRFGVAAVAMAIVSQTLAAPIVSESFEGPASGSLVTNLTGWSSTGGDLSIVTNMEYTYTATSLPLTNSVTHTNVARLVTEGGMLSFTNGAPVAFSTEPVYVDTMVRFVVSDSDPTASSITNDTKLAIFVNSSSNLVIRHGALDEEANFFVTNSVIDTVELLGARIDPSAWYRLTVKLTVNESARVRVRVAVNSNVVTNAYAPDGLFRSAIDTDVDADLAAVSFMGTGFIDDVVVTPYEPSFVSTVSVFSYVIEEHTNDVFVASILVATTNDFATGWSKTYAVPSNAWFTNTPALGSGTTEAVFTLDGRTVTSPAPDVAHNNTNYVLKVLLEDRAKTDLELPLQFHGISSNDIAWIRSFGKSPSDTIYTNANSLAFEQAMKLSPYAEELVTAQITSFTVGALESTIVVKALTNGVAYASPSGLTVNVLIDSKASLTNAWPVYAGFTNPVTQFNVLGEATNTFNTPVGTFFRARILPIPQ